MSTPAGAVVVVVSIAVVGGVEVVVVVTAVVVTVVTDVVVVAASGPGVEQATTVAVRTNERTARVGVAASQEARVAIRPRFPRPGDRRVA